MDVNSLRILNDYLNQTIDALLRGQQRAAIGLGGAPSQVGWPTVGWPGAGLSHSPFAASGIFGAAPVVDPIGLSHTNAFGQFGFPGAFGGQLPGFGGAIPTTGANAPFIDPFSVQRGLTHTPYGNNWGGVAPLALEMARQQQLTQAIAARQSVLEAMCRSVGIPV
jgi:hypothetical protein